MIASPPFGIVGVLAKSPGWSETGEAGGLCTEPDPIPLAASSFRGVCQGALRYPELGEPAARLSRGPPLPPPATTTTTITTTTTSPGVSSQWVCGEQYQ